MSEQKHTPGVSVVDIVSVLSGYSKELIERDWNHDKFRKWHRKALAINDAVTFSQTAEIERLRAELAEIKSRLDWFESSYTDKNGTLWQGTNGQGHCALVRALNEVKAGRAALVVVLKDVQTRIENSEAWWMDEPDRGGFDLVAINEAIAQHGGQP